MTTKTTVGTWREGTPDRPADERAQPGDVLGIEHDGETTELGDTAEDEDERREDAEDDVLPER
jgi:peptide subunit release factor RF-3